MHAELSSSASHAPHADVIRNGHADTCKPRVPQLTPRSLQLFVLILTEACHNPIHLAWPWRWTANNEKTRVSLRVLNQCINNHINSGLSILKSWFVHWRSPAFDVTLSEFFWRLQLFVTFIIELSICLIRFLRSEDPRDRFYIDWYVHLILPGLKFEALIFHGHYNYTSNAKYTMRALKHVRLHELFKSKCMSYGCSFSLVVSIVMLLLLLRKK